MSLATDSSNNQAAITELMAGEMAQVDAVIHRRLASEVVLINQISHYIVSAGGKRLRPMLVLLFSRALGFEGPERFEMAATVEFIHTATLLHDDVVDESELRRGRASANAIFGNKPSVLVGDFLFARAFQLMVADGSLEVLRKSRTRGLVTKSNLILGMGETREEISEALRDLHSAGTELITITQYLRPSVRHHPIDRWVRPEEFDELAAEATEIGYVGVQSGPLVRSSYRAGRMYRQAFEVRKRARRAAEQEIA